MKKTILLFAISIITAFIFLASCKPSEVEPSLIAVPLDTTVVIVDSVDTSKVLDPVGPSLEFYAASNQSFVTYVEDTITFAVVTAKGDANLDKLTFSVDGNLVEKTKILVDDQVLSVDGEYMIKASEDTSKTYTIKYITNSTSATETLVVAVIDEVALTKSVEINVRTIAYAPTTLSSITLGAQASVFGSYLSASGIVTNSNLATSAKDMLISFAQVGFNFAPNLISPNTNDRIEAGLAKGSDGSATTYFCATDLTLSASGKDIKNASVCIDKHVTPVLNGVYLFRQGDFKGLIKVTELNAPSNVPSGSVVIDLKQINLTPKL